MDLVKKFLVPKQKQVSVCERRKSPRFRLKTSALLCSENKQTICILLEDIGAGGVRFRSDTPLKENQPFVLKLHVHGNKFLFGLKLLWKKKDFSGNRIYGGSFVGPGNQESPAFKEFLKTFDWKPVFQHLNTGLSS
jgi:hypothetical protein